MNILFYDVVQESDAPDSLKSPSLADVTNLSAGGVTFTLPTPRYVNCIGIGNFNAATLRVYLSAQIFFNIVYTGPGLYLLPINGLPSIETGNYPAILTGGIGITSNGTYIGRLAAGLAVDLGTSIAKQPGWGSTSESRVSLSGQVLPGRGGYTYRTLGLNTSYGIDKRSIEQFTLGYQYIAMDYPFFLDFYREQHKLPFSKLYAVDKNQKSMSFEGGVMDFLYSYRWQFEERF
jgi:hypothetical protein